MSKLRFDSVNMDSVRAIQEKVENHSSTINKVVNEIINPYCKDLDRYVEFIKDCLNDGNKYVTTDELDDFCMNLSTLLYFVSGACESLGIRDDISKAVYKEVYHVARQNEVEGTIADKDSFAELASQQEQIVNMCYSRAYKKLRAKADSAQELLSSCKKVLSRRISEQELTKVSKS